MKFTKWVLGRQMNGEETENRVQHSDSMIDLPRKVNNDSKHQ